MDNTEGRVVTPDHASIMADQPSGLADRAGSLLWNHKVQQEGLWEKRQQELIPGP